MKKERNKKKKKKGQFIVPIGGPYLNFEKRSFSESMDLIDRKGSIKGTKLS